MKKITLFGAGNICKQMIPHLREHGYEILAIADNDEAKQGTELWGIPIINPNCLTTRGGELLVTLNPAHAEEVKGQMAVLERPVTVVDERMLAERRRWISYAHGTDLEDLILFHFLHDEPDIFYIDAGSNDPTCASVTKLFYECGRGHGINIEPQRLLYEQTCRERERDVNLCCGIGSEAGEMAFYVQGGLSTVLAENRVEARHPATERIQIRTLADICREYVPQGQAISFLKIDVEGFEREALLGADFEHYRPAMVCMEATLPNTHIPCHDKWEDVLTGAGYHFVYEYGINRYYVADERSDLDCRTEPAEHLLWIYNVRHASFS